MSRDKKTQINTTCPWCGYEMDPQYVQTTNVIVCQRCGKVTTKPIPKVSSENWPPRSMGEKRYPHPRRIWKYTLQPGRTVLEMPKGAKVLSVGSQPLQTNPPSVAILLWASVVPDNPTEKRTFVAMETNVEFDPTNLDPIGIVIFADDIFVFHVFEDVTLELKNV